jgi:hypothetical protein
MRVFTELLTTGTSFIEIYSDDYVSRFYAIYRHRVSRTAYVRNNMKELLTIGV